jgi:hypothetical protein
VRTPTTRLGLAALLLAQPALAGELQIGGTAQTVYDSNVFGIENDPVDDFELLLAPTAALDEKFGDFETKFDFKPTYELFFDEQDLRGWNYDFGANAAWIPSSATTVTLDDRFLRYGSMRLLTTGAEPGSTGAERGARDEFTRNIVSLNAEHHPSEISRIIADASYGLWNFEEPGRVDQDFVTADLQYLRALSETITLGGGLSFTRQNFEATGPRPKSHTDFYGLSALFYYEPTERITFRLSAGPTLVRRPVKDSFERGEILPFTGTGYLVAFPGTCPTLPTGEPFLDSSCFFVEYPVALAGDLGLGDTVPVQGSPDPDSWTYFADVSLERKWERGSVSLSYNRDEGAASSSLDFSSIVDTVELRGNYQVWRELTLVASVIWDHRKETDALGTIQVLGLAPGAGVLVPVELIPDRRGRNREQVDGFSAYASAQYQIGRYTRVDASVSWRNQDATQGSTFGDFERWFAAIGITFDFKPIRW